MLRPALFISAVLIPSLTFAGGKCSGVKGGCGRTSYSSSSRSSSPGGSVHVSGYVRKDGTYVRPHTRSAPGTAHLSGDVPETYSAPPAPTTPSTAIHIALPKATVPMYRATARTEPRTTAWTGDAIEDVPQPKPLPSSEIAAAPITKTDQDWRVWTDRSGKFTVEAKFIGLPGGVAWLHKRDETIVKVPLQTLSDADQEWIKHRLAQRR